jgi:hypothetical protein
MFYALTALQAGQDVHFLVTAIGGDQLRHRLTNDFLGAIAKQAAGAFVPAGDDSLQRLADNRVVGKFHNSR